MEWCIINEISLNNQLAILGGALIDPDATAQFAEQITPDYFDFPEGKQLAEKILKLYAEGKRADFITASDSKAEQELALRCAEMIPSLAAYPQYIERIKTDHESKRLRIILNDSLTKLIEALTFPE